MFEWVKKKGRSIKAIISAIVFAEKNTDYVHQAIKKTRKIDLEEIKRIIDNTPKGNVKKGFFKECYPFFGSEYGMKYRCVVLTLEDKISYKQFTNEINNLTHNMNALRNEENINGPKVLDRYYDKEKKKGYYIMECSEGQTTGGAIKKSLLNEDCPQKHLNEFVRQCLDAKSRSVKLDWKKGNFFYDTVLGFSLIDFYQLECMTGLPEKHEVANLEKSNIVVRMKALFGEELMESEGFASKLDEAFMANGITKEEIGGARESVRTYKEYAIRHNPFLIGRLDIEGRDRYDGYGCEKKIDRDPSRTGRNL